AKISLGLPYYGFAWTLVDANNRGLLAPANSWCSCTAGGALIAQNSTTTVFNSMFVSDYCYNGTTWIGYDDVQSIHTKVTYAKGKGLLGYFSWQITIGLSPN
ncbi:class v chitinase, partial [Quercus suber]